MNSQGFPGSLDSLDTNLIRELEMDARTPYNRLAEKLGVSRSTIQGRVQKLLDARVIEITCLANQVALGYRSGAILALNAEPRKLNELVSQLQPLPRIRLIMLCTGRFDVIAWSIFRDRHELAKFLSEDLRAMPGLEHMETMVVLKHLKGSWTLLADDPALPLAKTRIDDMDIALIGALQSDPRQTSDQLGSKLGTDGSTVRRRMQRLSKNGVIRIQALADPFALGFNAAASIGLKVDPSGVNEAAEALASYRNVHSVSICTGRYDIVIWVVLKGMGDLHHFLTSEVGRLAGLKDSETMISLKIPKSLRRSAPG